MKPSATVARSFLLGKNGVHLCAKAECDCVAELTRIVEQERDNGARSKQWHSEQLRLAKPRIAEALAETRSSTRAGR